jgi:two-component system sensor histidine kinase YesM
MKRSFLSYLDNRVFILALAAFAAFALFAAGAFFLCLSAGGFYFIPVIFIVISLALFIAAREWVLLPCRKTEKALRLFAEGYSSEDISNIPQPLSAATDEAMTRVQETLKNDALINAGKRQAQYLALQNQINPHFLYNALEGIRSDALAAGLENVAKMAEALGTFFRYTISNVENLVSLKEELENAENYFVIQRYRFGERISMETKFDGEEDRAELLNCKLPKLTLQPIVENAVVHGFERKIGNGRVVIKTIGTPERLIITVSDDGLGMSRDALETLSQKLNRTYYDYIASEGAGGIALVNVNNRIRLLFGANYGVAARGAPGAGTDVEITLPRIYETGGNAYER